MVVLFYILSSSVQGLQFLYVLSFVIKYYLFDYCHLSRYEVVSLSFDLDFPGGANEVVNIFMYLMAVRISSSEKSPFISLHIFFSWVIYIC